MGGGRRQIRCRGREGEEARARVERERDEVNEDSTCRTQGRVWGAPAGVGGRGVGEINVIFGNEIRCFQLR